MGIFSCSRPHIVFRMLHLLFHLQEIWIRRQSIQKISICWKRKGKPFVLHKWPTGFLRQQWNKMGMERRTGSWKYVFLHSGGISWNCVYIVFRLLSLYYVVCTSQFLRINGRPFPVKAYADKIEILISKGSLTSEAAIEFTDESPHIARVSFTIHKAGQYSISAKFDGRHVRGSLALHDFLPGNLP